MRNYLYKKLKEHDHNTQFLIKLTMVSIALLLVRLIYTHSFKFFFLPWNLFLAFVPYLISINLHKAERSISNLKLVLILFIWWVFLPNAPYLITDLVHLKLSTGPSIWLDILVIFVFSLTGLILGFQSIQHVKAFLQNRFKTPYLNLFPSLVVLSCGFGIYLGRIERLNSWDIMLHPISNLCAIVQTFIQSDSYKASWSFSLMLGLFLLAMYHIFSLFVQDEKEKEPIC